MFITAIWEIVDDDAAYRLALWTSTGMVVLTVYEILDDGIDALHGCRNLLRTAQLVITGIGYYSY